MAVTTTPTKRTLKVRIEELQARRRATRTTDRPKWMHKPRILSLIKEAELVSLDRDSDLAKIPAELQLHVISYLDYEDVLGLKRTCRYFNYFINADVMKESKEAQIAHYKQLENKTTTNFDKLPCYRCLKMKPKSEYWHKTGKYYLNSPPYTYNWGRNTTSHTPDYDRHCIRCSFFEGEYEPGTRLNTGNQSWMICGCCGILAKEVYNSSRYPNTVCAPCAAEYTFNHSHGGSMRIMQWAIAVVILPLACTGKFMPWTSRADEHSLRWILTITLDLLTIGGTFASLCTRLQNNYSRYSNKRSENCKFVFPVEFTAFGSWMAVLTATFVQARYRHFTGRYDRFAKGLTALIFIECLLFLVTTLWANRYTREFLVPKSRRPKNGSFV